jgi:hypothetical protein
MSRPQSSGEAELRAMNDGAGPSEDELLALGLAASAKDVEPVSPELEAKLMEGFRNRKPRVGVSTTAAGTQTFDLDALVDEERPVRRASPMFSRFAMAATLVIAVGATLALRAAKNDTRSHASTAASTLSLSSSNGAVRVRLAPDERPREAFVHVENAGGVFDSSGKIFLSDGVTLPPSVASRVADGHLRVRITAGPDATRDVLFEGYASRE